VAGGTYVNFHLSAPALVRPWPPSEGSTFHFDLVVECGGERETLPVRFTFAPTADPRISPWSR
jgi:hypothetical protein